MEGVIGRALILIILVLVLVLPCDSLIGYDIVVDVPPSHWEIHRSTQAMLFSNQGEVNGTGNFSRYNKLENFAGINAKEQSYSLKGNLDYADKVLMRTLEGPVTVTINLESTTLPEDSEANVTNEFTVASSGKIDIDEMWPAYYTNYKKISYFGPGIKTKEYYDNNGDIMSTAIDSWKLSKESLYQSSINRTIIEADISTNGVIEQRLGNTSSSYKMNLLTQGTSTDLDASRLRYNAPLSIFGRPEIYTQVSQQYVGEQRMGLNIKMDKSVIRPPIETEPWLDCCSGGYLTMPKSYQMGEGGLGSNLESVFDCTCFKP